MLFEVTDLYAPNYAASRAVVVNQGGTGSSKTYTILQVLFTLLSQGQGLVATVAGQDIPNLKVGALRDAEMIVESSPALQTCIKEYSKSERIYRFHNGSLLEFKSYDDPQDAKSGKRDYLFVNEANGIPYPVYQELYLRTRIRTWVDYNPNAEFWVHEHLIGKPHVQFFRSWYVHNRFLPERMIATIEALKEQDHELWRVYARGKTGKIEGLVFRDVFNADLLPDGAKYLGTGLDFGFTNDPTACYDVYQSGGELYIDELLYQTGLTNPDIFAALTNVRPAARFSVVADSAEPKSIEELRRLGLPIAPAAKGPDSINAGIDTLKRYRLNLLPSCVNLKKELSNYKWKVDRLTGKATNTPVDAYNHGCFIAGTQVLTISGSVPIERVVAGDMVLTRMGHRKVLKSWKTGENKPVNLYKISCSVGDYSVSCTPNHKVLTQDGWKPISTLKTGDTIWTPKSLTEKPISCTKGSGIFRGAASGFTAWCGNLQTALSRRAFMFTTLMGTPRITHWEISRYWPHPYTPLLTLPAVDTLLRQTCSETLMQSGRLQRLGTPAMKGYSGTKPTLRQTASVLMTSLKSLVNSAKLLLSPLLTTPAFAGTTASLLFAAPPELTLWAAPAPCAMPSFKSASICPPELVPVLVVAVLATSIGKADVYDLNVETEHEFVANGVLVHNCDAVRYLTTARLQAPPLIGRRATARTWKRPNPNAFN